MKNQRGMVSLTVTIIVGILLVLIVTAASVIMLGELSQATDGDQSVRAYYAAESGAERGIRIVLDKIKANPNDALSGYDQCPAAPNFGTNYGYTCLKLKKETQQLDGRLNKDKVNQLNLIGDTFNSMKLSWNLQSENPSVALVAPNVSQWPSGAGWNLPAVMELEIISMDNGTTNNVATRYIEVLPGTTPVPVGGYNESTSSVLYSSCARSAAYTCTVTLGSFVTGRGNKDYIIRILPRYAAADYKVDFLGANVTLSTATIDSTARAGSVYRRAVYSLKYTSGNFILSSPGYGNFSDSTICGAGGGITTSTKQNAPTGQNYVTSGSSC